jgi:peptidyl-prolyl cis-trans isomerase SurA
VLRTSIAVTAAALAAVSVLAACGPVQMGAAAIVGNQRISAIQLGNEVSNLEQYYQAHKSKIQLQFPPSQAPQEVLAWLIRFKVRDELALRNHVRVSSGQGEQAKAAIAAQAGPSGIKALAVANGLPPDMLTALGRYEALQNAIVTRIDGGHLPSSTTAQQLIGAELARRQCVAAKALNIRINPQFGRLDYGQFSIVPAANTLSAPVTPSPKPSTAPQLKPQC